MYCIMNKDRKIAEFDYIKNHMNISVPKLVSGELPAVFGDISLKNWLETRRSAKHRAEIAKLLRSLGMTDLLSRIQYGLKRKIQIQTGTALISMITISVK